MEEHRHTTMGILCPECEKTYEIMELKDGKCPMGHIVPTEKAAPKFGGHDTVQ